MARKPRLATYQAAITLHRDQHDTGSGEPAKTALTTTSLEDAIRALLTSKGFPDATVRIMRTDI